MKIVVLAVLFLTGLIAVAIAAPMEDIYDKVDPETGNANVVVEELHNDQAGKYAHSKRKGCTREAVKVYRIVCYKCRGSGINRICDQNCKTKQVTYYRCKLQEYA